jgi:ketol-acid reductoisomerase
LNLRDSGVTVLVGVRPGPSFERAHQDGFGPTSPITVVRDADLVMVLTPDETHAEVCKRYVFGHARDGTHIGFAAGFSIHFGVVRPPRGLRPIMVAPKGPGSVLRASYESGRGIPAMVAAAEGDFDGLELARAYAVALGCGRAGIVTTTFREEAIADLFGEQCVLCGGLTELMRAAFDTLVDRGYAPEVAYIECVAEVEYIASLISRVGLAGLGDHISSTAAYGGATRGPRIFSPELRERLNHVLDEIEDGRFYEEFRKPGTGSMGRTHYREVFQAIERARSAFEVGDRDGK